MGFMKQVAGSAVQGGVQGPANRQPQAAPSVPIQQAQPGISRGRGGLPGPPSVGATPGSPSMASGGKGAGGMRGLITKIAEGATGQKAQPGSPALTGAKGS